MFEVLHNAIGYKKHAEECVRLANLTADDLIQKELLTLRQAYLQTAERLGHLEAKNAADGYPR